MAAYPGENQLTLKLLVDKKNNKVLSAEAGKEFVDVLMSFLTLPLGTIVRLTGKYSEMLDSVNIGCLNTLYQSAGNLHERHLWTKACKKMLLKPKNYSMESYCQNLKLKIDDTKPTSYYVCDMCLIKGCNLVSTFRDLRCKCGDFINQKIYGIQMDPFVDYDGFVHDSVTFIICDDLSLMPSIFGPTMALLQNLGFEDTNSLEEMTANVSTEEVLDLLKLSFLSKTPLTNLFLKKKQFLEGSYSTTEDIFKIGEVRDYKDVEVILKVVSRKSNQEILYYEAGEDFVDILFSFLTFPLGGVLNLLEGSSSLHCMDTLYKSVAEMSVDKCFKSQELKDALVKPNCPPKAIPAIPLRISDEFDGCYIHTVYKYCSKRSKDLNSMDYVDPTSTTGETSSGRRLLKGPTSYLVTDGLVVTPVSSFSADSLVNRFDVTSSFSFLSRFKVPLNEVEKKVIRIGSREVLGILKASLISNSVLTNVFRELIDVGDQ